MVFVLSKSVLLLFVVSALALSGCSTVPKKLANPTQHPYAKTEQELMLVQQSIDMKADLNKQGLIISKGSVSSYISKLGNDLLKANPSAHVPIRFHVMRSPMVNAMAAPNGDIYVNLGLIAMVENEAQLAMVMCHEIAHVTGSHGFENAANRKDSLIAAHIADLMLFGTGIAYIPFIANMASYSRDQETESDVKGMECLSNAGYPVAEAARVFELMNELRAKSASKGSIFSSHPELEDRVTLLTAQMNKYTDVDFETGQTQGFESIRYQALDKTLRSWFRTKNYHMAIQVLEQSGLSESNPDKAAYYKAEALRGMASAPELAAKEYAFLNDQYLNDELKQRFIEEAEGRFQEAIAHYQHVLDNQPDHAESHRGLGMIYKETGNAMLASKNLNRYLVLNPQARDRRYISHLIKQTKE